ncbi:AMP-binding protein [Nocardia sp. NPDC004860]|uniref:(2,3-dihydroxybenzoyl)adenylate synthase n=1 Tax=Nocardia sp. NPDC004860 TaxID=3154557 RepID=UPI0033A3264A
MINWSGRLVHYPVEVAERYRSAGLWGSLPIGAEFHEVAARQGARPAIVAEEGSLSYIELDEITDRLALGLQTLGFVQGDRVIVQLTNRLYSVVAWYGLLKAGLIPVCTLAAHRGNEIGGISRKVGAVAHIVESTVSGFDLVAFAQEQCAGHPTMRHVLTVGTADDRGVSIERLIDESFDAATAREAVSAIQSQISPDEIACFQLSGGTTGLPKVIPRLHAEYWYNAKAFAEVVGWDEETRTAYLYPIIHNGGITLALHAVHSVGGTLVLGTPALDQALPVFAEGQATDVLIGHGHYNMVEHPLFDEAMASVKRVVLSGAKVPERLFEAFERKGIWLGQNFGMGEGFCANSTSKTIRDGRLNTVGVPISPYDEFRVFEPGTDINLPDGEVGELACRGPYTIRGYFDADDINEAAFMPDGFYRTGDLVAIRQYGDERCISIEGRIKNLINRGGEKISPDEVERLLLCHPRIMAAAVVAMPDTRLGERACAYLVTTGEPLTLKDVQAHLEGLSLAKFKWPERIETITEMPKTAVGKLDKKVLQRDIVAKVAGDE